MERDDFSRGAKPPTNNPAEPGGEGVDERGEKRTDIVESSGYTTTKQAAKLLGVSRRTVQSYVRRGDLEAVVEGEGVEIGVLHLHRLPQRLARAKTLWRTFAGNAGDAPGASAHSDISTNAAKLVGELAPDLIEVVQDLRYRLGRAEAQVRLTARTESTLRKQLAREQAREDRLEAELREARRPTPEARDSDVTATEENDRRGVLSEPQEPLERRSQLYSCT